MTVEAFIKSYLIKTAGVESAKLDDPNINVAELGLDSLGLIDVLLAVEDKFGVQILDPMKFRTMQFSEMLAIIECQIQIKN